MVLRVIRVLPVGFAVPVHTNATICQNFLVSPCICCRLLSRLLLFTHICSSGVHWEHSFAFGKYHFMVPHFHWMGTSGWMLIRSLDRLYSCWYMDQGVRQKLMTSSSLIEYQLEKHHLCFHSISTLITMY